MQLLVEDDYGLWEIAWRLGGVEAAVPVVEQLCLHGLAELYVRDWIDAEPIPLARSGREVGLRDPCCWNQPTADDPHLLLIATEAGREAVARQSNAGLRPEE